MAYVDSIDKVVQSYFAAVAAKPFLYKGTLYEPSGLLVSPDLLRGFTCPEMCGGCCPRFSLDYLPTEKLPYEMPMRSVFLDGMEVLLYSDMQEDVTSHHCRNLLQENGRCGIHGAQPFSCDFELIRFAHFSQRNTYHITTRLFGRGWAMLRVDGERGARCTITSATQDSRMDVIRKLERLAEWCEHFGVEHHVHRIIDWALNNPCKPFTLAPPATRKHFLY